MSRGGRSVHESVHAVGRSAAEARSIVATMLAAGDGHQFVELNTSSYQVVSATRGLLGKRIETCTVTVVEGPTGATVTLAGRLDAQRIGALRAALTERVGGTRHVPLAADTDVVLAPLVASATSSTVASATGSSTTVSAVALDHETIFRSESGAPKVQIAPSPMRFELRFDSGDVRPLRCTLVIGRDPSEEAGGPGAERVRIDDGQVSKAHASLGVDESGAWVEDLHSTNGTFVHVHGRDPVSVIAGHRHRLEPGSVVRFGTRFVTLARAD